MASATTTTATDPDVDEEQVSLVRLPPSPTLEQTSSSLVSTSASLRAASKAPLPRPRPSTSLATTIPTPKSTSSGPSPPPDHSATHSSLRPRPQVQDNCMFCTPETAPPGENLEWIQCNGCKRWCHILCTGLPLQTDILSIDKFHCKRCEKTRGPTTCIPLLSPLTIVRPPPRKSERSHVNIDYTSLNLGDTTTILPDQHAYNAFFEGEAPRRFAPDRFLRLRGSELTKEWAERTGCKEPVLVPRGSSEGMGMVMPVDLTVRKVAEMVGEDQKVEVIGISLKLANTDVPTQKEAPNWRLKQWADYYDTPADQRDRVRNVISLEVSSSSLGAQIVRPQFVRDLDLIEKVWPAHLRPQSPTSANPTHAAVVLPTASNTPSNIIFPKVTLYCLMSVARSYTDFHVDFGGSSVFYHILRGKKTFLFIEPTPTNLRRYETWCGDSDQARRFLGGEVKECIRVDLSAGDTMIIPSGWIHAVYTPSDSLVIGGNFLTPLHIPSQLQIANIETRTRVPKKFRFPFFDMAMWYTAVYYLDTYIPRRKRGPPPKAGRRNTEGMSEYEIGGLRALAEWLWRKAKLRTQQIAKGAEYHRAKVEVPPGLDVMDTAGRFARWVYDGDDEEDNPGWFRSEVLLVKLESAKKRKTDDVPVRRGRRGMKRELEDNEQGTRKRRFLDIVVPEPVDYAMTYGLSRPVTTYSNYTDPTILRPMISYLPMAKVSTSQPLTIHKPYSKRRQHPLDPPGKSFIEVIKSTCRPYHQENTLLLEEIKVEEEPLGGLDALSRAVELATTQPTYYPPSSPGSTLTIFSPDHIRLPTPPSQSPPPLYDGVVREAALGLRQRSSSGAMPMEDVAEDSEMNRLMGLFSAEEMIEFRKKRRRGAGYVFSIASLKKELDRIERRY